VRQLTCGLALDPLEHANISELAQLQVARAYEAVDRSAKRLARSEERARRATERAERHKATHLQDAADGQRQMRTNAEPDRPT